VSGAPRLLIVASVPDTLVAFLLPYAAHYRAKGWRVDAAARGAPEVALVTEAFDAVHHVPWTRSPTDPGNLTTAVRALQDLVVREGYDLVHVHDPIAAFVTRFALRSLRRRTGVRVAYTAHGFHFFAGNAPHRNALFYALEVLASRWTDAQVVINREDEAAARRWPFASRHRLTYMPGIGVDTSRYDPSAVSDEDVARVRHDLGLAPGQPLVTMLAEFNPGKRHRDLVAALARADRPGLVLALAGVGPLEGAVRDQAEALGLGDRVKLLGYRRDVPALLRASVALALPSEREGLPRSIMEGSCLERPVIATRVRGVTELVTPATGVLVDVGDVDALAGALRWVVDEPEDAAARGRAGRAAMRAFDLGPVLAMHDALYERLLEGSAAVRARRATPA
jgi:glycosyltransferase involved in cell wall biosynthesis